VHFIQYILLLSLFCVSVVSTAGDIESERWSPRDEDLRILQVQVDRYKLEDILPAYQRKDYLLLPLGYMAEILDLAIEVDIGTGIANGFVIKESNTFYLDTTRNEVIVKGVSQTYNRVLIYVLDDDIYIDSTLLAKWFDITINVDLFASVITFNSKDLFPFIERIKREEKIAKAQANLNKDTPYYPYHYEPYDMLNVPFIDQTFQNTNRFGDKTTNTLNSTTYMTADVLGMSASSYLFASEDGSRDDFRFTLGKKSPDAELLGFAHATEYAMGDFTEPRLKNITVPGKQEAGVLVSSFPLNHQAEYDTHRFQGNLLPGWEVELYRNDRLIGYQSVADNGLYDFKDVSILFGRNYFRLVFYGPQGQHREEEEVFELGQSLTQKGQHYYRVLASDNDGGGSRATAQYDVGLTDQVSLSLVGVSVPLNKSQKAVEQHNYVQVGLRGFWKSLFATVDVMDDLNGGKAINLDLQTGFGGTVIKFNHTILNNFFSEEYQLTAQEFKDNTEIRIDATIPPSFLPRIPLSLELKMSDFVSGNDRNELVNVLSLQTYGLSLTNQLTYVQNSTAINTFTGGFGISSYIDGIGIRGTVNYAFQPKDEITTVDLTVRPRLYKQFQFTYGLNHALKSNLTQVSVSASKGLGKYNLSVGVRYDTDNVYSLDTRFSIGLGREPRKRKWEPNALSIAGRGSVSARVFLDKNQDGLFNGDDEPLKDVGFTLNGGYVKTKTDDDGIAYITSIPEYKPVNLVIKQATLIDPLWTAAIDGMRIVPRPGQAMQLDFPIFTRGEIDGTVSLLKNNKLIGAGRVKVEVVDDAGRVVRSATTEYDGFYVVSDIPLGSYKVRVSPTQMAELGLQAGEDLSFTLTADDQFESGIDFEVRLDSTNSAVKN
jgi:hypothetical protein